MEELKNIISEYVGIDKTEIKNNTSLVENTGLDSFGMVSLLCEIEDKFKVSIPEYDLSNFQTFSDLSNYLSENSPCFARF